ncbi:MAG: hypothetical protein IT205_04645 [Fimbriimonadaceae bacterium]|nr:hypothetical protein [Fimbriimonadaceae bacterium]
MNRRTSFFLALMLVGCQATQTVVEPKGGSKSESSDRPSPIVPNVADNSDENPSDPQKVSEKKITAEIAKQERDQVEATRVTVAQPGSNGWRLAKVDPLAFGAMLDDASKKWSDIAGSFEMTLQNTEMRGQQLGKFLISDKSLYRIEYVDVGDPTGPNVVRADGKNKLILNGKQPVKKGLVGQPGQPLAKGMFYRLFTRQAFEPFTEGRPTWEPVLSNLKQQGYSVTLESKDMESGGVMRPFYRLIAKKPGQGLNAFEARFDGIRLVPLTMKMNATSADGKPITAEWRAIWNFNQQVKDKLI